MAPTGTSCLSNAFRASARAALIHSSLLKAILMNLISKSMKKTWYSLFKSNIFLNDKSGYCRDRKLKFAPLTIPAIYPNLTAMFFHKFLAEQQTQSTVSYTHLRAHETVLDLVCRLLLEKKKHEGTKTTYEYSTEENNKNKKYNKEDE